MYHRVKGVVEKGFSVTSGGGSRRRERRDWRETSVENSIDSQLTRMSYV